MQYTHVRDAVKAAFYMIKYNEPEQPTRSDGFQKLMVHWKKNKPK